MGHDVRDPPFFFAKPADAIVPDGSTVPYPPLTKDLHHEVEHVVALKNALQVSRLKQVLDKYEEILKLLGGDMGHELAALGATGSRGDTDLDPELIRPMRLTLADAIHLRRMQGIDLGSELTLILSQDAPG
jgi:hypothetical protein